jgi:hypothetical protein
LRTTVCEVMSAYTNDGKISAKRNSMWKSTVTETDHSTLGRIVSYKSQNYCSKGEKRAEPNILLEDSVYTKTVQRELHKSNIHSMVAIAKPLITESNAQKCLTMVSGP